MNKIALGTVIAALSLGLLAVPAEAKRLGGGGMKRPVPTQPAPKPATPPAPNAPAQQQAAPQPAAPAPAAPPAAAPKRSWMGPLAGLAAGLGLAALASHFGFGAALANVMTIVLLGLAALLLIGFVMRRFGAQKAGPQLAGAGAPFPTAAPAPSAPVAVPQAAAAPAQDGFDAAGFESIAKQVFIRMQAANDAGDQNDLRRFTTPQMYASIQQELLDRKGAAQRTDVLQLDARVLERVEEQGEQIVSVRFWGLVREQSEAAATDFDEVWHLVRPLDGSREWAIAGIQATV